VLLISLDGLLTFWDESRLDEDSHVMLTLKGPFKGEVDERWHLISISDATRSGLPFRKWMERVLHRRVNLQVQESGWLFQDRRGARLKFGQYDPLYRALRDQARERHPRLLLDAVETKDFSLWRSPRRGAVLETTNQDVSEKVIELINRWRKNKKEAAKCSEAGLAMRQVYTQVRSTLPTMLKFSKALSWEEISPFFSGVGLRICSESCLNFVEHEVFGFPRCHLGQYVNPGYPVETKSETCGRVKDNVPHENCTDTIVPSG